MTNLTHIRASRRDFTTGYSVFGLPFYYKIMLVLLKFEIVRIALELILMTGPSAGYRKGFVYLQSIKFSLFILSTITRHRWVCTTVWLRLGRDFPTWAPINTTWSSHDLYLSHFCGLLVTGGDEWNLKTELKLEVGWLLHRSVMRRDALIMVSHESSDHRSRVSPHTPSPAQA